MKVLEDMNTKRNLEDYNILEPYKWEAEQKEKQKMAEETQAREERLKVEKVLEQIKKDEEEKQRKEHALKREEETKKQEEELRLAEQEMQEEAERLKKIEQEADEEQERPQIEAPAAPE